MDIEIIEKLSNKIWITRKCRINTSERLIKTRRTAQFLTTYYTLMIISISIWSLFDENTLLSFLIIIASLFLFGTTTIIESLNFQERIIFLKNCYIELDDLILDLEILKKEFSRLQEEQIKVEFTRIKTNYRKLLENVENHSVFDHLKFLLENDNSKMSSKDYLYFYFLKISFISIVIILMILPVIPLFF